LELAPPAFEGDFPTLKGAFPESLAHAPPGYDAEAPRLRETNLDHLELPATIVAADLTPLERDPFTAESTLSASRLAALALAPPGFEVSAGSREC
jgi:hypothetical protein